MSNRTIDGIMIVICIIIGVTYALWVDGGPPYMMGG